MLRATPCASRPLASPYYTADSKTTLFSAPREFNESPTRRHTRHAGVQNLNYSWKECPNSFFSVNRGASLRMCSSRLPSFLRNRLVGSIIKTRRYNTKLLPPTPQAAIQVLVGITRPPKMSRRLPEKPCDSLSGAAAFTRRRATHPPTRDRPNGPTHAKPQTRGRAAYAAPPPLRQRKPSAETSHASATSMRKLLA